ncbi:MAG: 3-hydroxyacyl-CoA dehydrogenase/enoyl-CoA hydratase family protein [Bacteroidia bacterium]
MKRRIKKVAVLGSGVMGSRLACHFANIGLHVLLLDIQPKELSEAEKAKGLSTDSHIFKNRIGNQALQSTLKSKPSPIYHKSFASRIEVGNFNDDLSKISECDWVLEAVIENLDIKKGLFEKVEKYRTPRTLITSNTSGIPINKLIEGRSEDFKAHFCGTHFFNPPRYLRLLEIIPTKDTLPEVTSFFMDYGDRFLGKTTVLAKDTPAFIANRVGVFSILLIFRLMEEFDMTVEEVDAITGPLVGRPKSATFRTCDVVGIDTLIKVADNLYEDCPDDESRAYYKVPDFVRTMVDNGWHGDKGGQGFYKKIKKEGKKEIQAINVKTLDYSPKQKVRFASVGTLREEENLFKRVKGLYKFPDKAGQFSNKFFNTLFAYVANRVPEISDEIYKVDDALKAGFGWEIGVFEVWDSIGFEKVLNATNIDSYPDWIKDMKQNGKTSFYKVEDGNKLFYNQKTGEYEPIKEALDFIVLDNYRNEKVLWSNKGASIFNLGDGVIGLEFHTKMNTMGSEVIQGINKAIDLAEKEYDALVIGNDGQNFSAGANLGMIFMLAVEQEYDELDFAIRAFQNTMMRIRYSSIPVVVAPFNMALGGGCEITLHADAVQASAETYIGLVEVGAGVIPGGGGTKEFALRASDNFYKGDPELPLLNERFMNIGMAKVATSAHEAFDLGILVEGRDSISINRSRLLADAKRKALQMVEAGYTQKQQRTDIKALGKSALGGLLSGTYAMQQAHYISEHDLKIAQKLAYVICGGDLSQPQLVSEKYLLNLEREAFLSLLGERKTLERIQSILKTGKPLRN